MGLDELWNGEVSARRVVALLGDPVDELLAL